ncbi:MAG: hypothetical protein PHR92_03450 [Lachnospiraceae bacterium]|nr:hypothetical protein [Lachnospiraceae bacterium]
MGGVVDPQHQFPVVIKGIADCYEKSDAEWTRSLNSSGGKTTMKIDLHLHPEWQQTILDNGCLLYERKSV